MRSQQLSAPVPHGQTKTSGGWQSKGGSWQLRQSLADPEHQHSAAIWWVVMLGFVELWFRKSHAKQ